LNLQRGNLSFDLEVVNTCDLCGGTEVANELIVNGWNLNKCIKCNLVFTSPRHTEAYLSKMYKDEYYDLASNYLHGQLSKPSKDLIRLATSLKERCTDSERLRIPRYLDVGCGGGVVVNAFHQAGWEAVGIDLNTKAIRLGQGRGLDLREESIEDQPLVTFDLISALHVLEHVHSPKQFLQRCAESIVPGGYILIEVPDYGCRASRKMGQGWPYLYPDGHLYQFTVDTISKYLNHMKFAIIQIQKVHGRGPLEDYSTCPTCRRKRPSGLASLLFSMRHVVYWSPLCRRIIRHILWNALGYGEFIRILARKKAEFGEPITCQRTFS
jgi:SAM-dependent methyltransferase